MSAFEGFTARSNNFDDLNFTDMTTEDLVVKINEAIDGLDFDVCTGLQIRLAQF